MMRSRMLFNVGKGFLNDPVEGYLRPRIQPAAVRIEVRLDADPGGILKVGRQLLERPVQSEIIQNGRPELVGNPLRLSEYFPDAPESVLKLFCGSLRR